MKKIIICITIILAFSSVAFSQKPGNKVVCFKSDMDCANCEKTITEYLKFEKGVKDLKVDHVSNTVMIEYKADKSTEDVFAKAIEKKGYKAEKITKEVYDNIMKETAEKGHEHEAEMHKVRK